jgi:hypothetical protein
MRKLKIVFSTLCLVSVLTLALPSAAYADGSQGGSNSTTTKPKAPPMSDWEYLLWLILLGLV